ncbi:MAG TPA: hypothetical protein VFN67_27550 [Polyangiales bacterium]|nr:hypothetical protein [Polyangiales bacterium]
MVCQTRAARADCGELCFLNEANQPLVGAKAALHVSSFITNGPTLPAARDYAGKSRAASDLRVQVDDPRAAAGAFVTLESRTAGGVLRAKLQLPLARPAPGMPLRSAYVRLVADEVDDHARGAESRTLRVALRDQVRVRYLSGERTLERSLRVGLSGDRDDAESARRANVVVHILRVSAEGDAVVGQDDASALSVMRQQLSAANEIWSQCNLSFGDPTEVSMEIATPPPATMLAVANEDGLPARGGGELRFRIDGQSVGPIATLAGASPAATAQSIAEAVRKQGYFAKVSENLATRSGAGPSADVLIRKKNGELVNLSTDDAGPLSSDARQSLQIGSVDLGDGLQEFDNTTAQVGSLEERTLLKALSDDDPHSIDIFVVNQFTAATRQGEAFIADPAGPITNSVVIDRNGLRHAPLAWTLAHELGHVLMDDPLHPDNVGPDRPWLLMDADSGRGTVDGPKRLRAADCQRMRETSRRARFPLLSAFDREDDAAVGGAR